MMLIRLVCADSSCHRQIKILDKPKPCREAVRNEGLGKCVAGVESRWGNDEVSRWKCELCEAALEQAQESIGRYRFLPIMGEGRTCYQHLPTQYA